MRLVHSNPELLAFSILRMVLEVCCKKSVSLRIEGCKIRSFFDKEMCHVEIDTMFKLREEHAQGDTTWQGVSATVPVHKVKENFFRIEIGTRVVVFIEGNTWCSLVYAGDEVWSSEEEVSVSK